MRTRPQQHYLGGELATRVGCGTLLFAAEEVQQVAFPSLEIEVHAGAPVAA